MMITARQRLAQRALRSLDVSSATPSFHLLSGTLISDPDNPAYNELISPISLVQKYGFNIEVSSSSSSTNNDSSNEPSSSSNANVFKEPDDLRSLNVIVSENDQCFFVNKEYLCAWSQQFQHAASKNVQEITFPGGEAQLQLLLNVIWPFTKRLTIDHVVDILSLSNQWRTHDALSDVAAYYLHSNISVTAVEKLKLAAQSGNLLLLYGTLNYQCKRDTIFEIVNRSPEDYSSIRRGAHSSLTVSKMLEHAAGDGDSDYKEALSGKLHHELTIFKRLCSELYDFSKPDHWRTTELICEGKIFFVNKAYLSIWSPVFYQIFYGDFRDRKQQRIPITDCSAQVLRLFLSLLHPSHLGAVWKMMPREYARNWRCNQWIDDLFLAIFDDNSDLLVEIFKLAHKYQVASLVDTCILFVETKSEFTLAEKMLMADAYHLPTLMALCVAKLTTPRAVKRMVCENDNLLPNLSCKAHRILLERLIALV